MGSTAHRFGFDALNRAELHFLFPPVFTPLFGPALRPWPIVFARFTPVSTLPDAGPPWSLCGHRNRKSKGKRAWTIKLTHNETGMPQAP